MILCPECGENVRGYRCRCGWEVPRSRPASSGSDPMYGCCEWVADGRCHYAGVSGHGKDGPYFCRGHENTTDPVVAAQIVEQSHRDIPHPNYSLAARKAASESNLRRDMEAWGNRFKEAA